MSWFKDLWDRLVVNYQSTITGLVVLVFTWASDHGIDVSQDNQKVATAKILAIALSLLKIFGKDAPAEPADPSTGGKANTSGRQFGSIALIFVLLFGTLTQVACGNATTLARVGATVVQVSKGITAEAASLRAAGLLTPAKLDALDKKAKAIEVSAAALQSYLNSLPGVNASNKAEVVSKVGETLSLVSALAQNPDVVGLPPDNLFVKILTFGNITLQNVAVVLAALNPPAASFSTIGAEASIPLSKIKVQAAPIPKGAEKYLK